MHHEREAVILSDFSSFLAKERPEFLDKTKAGDFTLEGPTKMKRNGYVFSTPGWGGHSQSDLFATG